MRPLRVSPQGSVGICSAGDGSQAHGEGRGYWTLSCMVTWAKVPVPVLCPSWRKLWKLVYALRPWELTHALAEMRLRGLDLVLGPGAKVLLGKEQAWPDCSLHFCHKRTQVGQGAANSSTGDGEAPAGTLETGGTMHGTQWCSPRDERELRWATAGIEAPLGAGWSFESIRRR